MAPTGPMRSEKTSQSVSRIAKDIERIWGTSVLNVIPDVDGLRPPSLLYMSILVVSGLRRLSLLESNADRAGRALLDARDRRVSRMSSRDSFSQRTVKLGLADVRMVISEYTQGPANSVAETTSPRNREPSPPSELGYDHSVHDHSVQPKNITESIAGISNHSEADSVGVDEPEVVETGERTESEEDEFMVNELLDSDTEDSSAESSSRAISSEPNSDKDIEVEGNRGSYISPSIRHTSFGRQLHRSLRVCYEKLSRSNLNSSKPMWSIFSKGGDTDQVPAFLQSELKQDSTSQGSDPNQYGAIDAGDHSAAQVATLSEVQSNFNELKANFSLAAVSLANRARSTQASKDSASVNIRRRLTNAETLLLKRMEAAVGDFQFELQTIAHCLAADWKDDVEGKDDAYQREAMEMIAVDQNGANHTAKRDYTKAGGNGSEINFNLQAGGGNRISRRNQKLNKSRTPIYKKRSSVRANNTTAIHSSACQSGPVPISKKQKAVPAQLRRENSDYDVPHSLSATTHTLSKVTQNMSSDEYNPDDETEEDENEAEEEEIEIDDEDFP